MKDLPLEGGQDSSSHLSSLLIGAISCRLNSVLQQTIYLLLFYLICIYPDFFLAGVPRDQYCNIYRFINCLDSLNKFIFISFFLIYLEKNRKDQ